MRDLLKAFASLAGAVITIGAMHTQHDTAQVILARGADYVMTVKANMPALYQQLKKLPWSAVPAVSAVSTGHGRRTRRTIKALLAPAWIEFDGAAQVAQLRRTVTKNGNKTVEVVYLITSDRDAGPATLAARTESAAVAAHSRAATMRRSQARHDDVSCRSRPPATVLRPDSAAMALPSSREARPPSRRSGP